ncbi:MAG: hypothetical protein RRA92_06485 [Gemmatimonadota bacterium]|nr:hypothetical protein [Gemmatimonadota bacterium]
MRVSVLVIPLVTCLAAAAACTQMAGRVYLPHEPGGAASDLSGPDVRRDWLAQHPDENEDIRAAIEEGVFIAGMTLEHRDVITNPSRRGAGGDAYWRSRTTGDEVRYQWFVSAERFPFVDGRGRKVCELVFVEGVIRDVRYCPEDAVGGSGEG